MTQIIKDLVTWLKQWFYEKSEVDAKIPKIYYGTCSTSASTNPKAVTTSSDYTLATGTILVVKFTNAQSFNASSSTPLKISVNNGTAINVAYTSGSDFGKFMRYMWVAGEVVTFAYDGTDFVVVDGAIATTTYYGVTKLENSVSSTSTTTSATPNSVKQAYDLANGKADANHIHDDRYYTETEVNTIINNLNNRISVNTEKQIIQTGDNISITGYRLENGSPLPNKVVLFYAE